MRPLIGCQHKLYERIENFRWWKCKFLKCSTLCVRMKIEYVYLAYRIVVVSGFSLETQCKFGTQFSALQFWINIYVTECWNGNNFHKIKLWFFVDESKHTHNLYQGLCSRGIILWRTHRNAESRKIIYSPPSSRSVFFIFIFGTRYVRYVLVFLSSGICFSTFRKSHTSQRLVGFFSDVTKWQRQQSLFI